MEFFWSIRGVGCAAGGTACLRTWSKLRETSLARTHMSVWTSPQINGSTPSGMRTLAVRIPSQPAATRTRRVSRPRTASAQSVQCPWGLLSSHKSHLWIWAALLGQQRVLLLAARVAVMPRASKAACYMHGVIATACR